MLCQNRDTIQISSADMLWCPLRSWEAMYQAVHKALGRQLPRLRHSILCPGLPRFYRVTARVVSTAQRNKVRKGIVYQDDSFETKVPFQ